MTPLPTVAMKKRPLAEILKEKFLAEQALKQATATATATVEVTGTVEPITPIYAPLTGTVPAIVLLKDSVEEVVEKKHETFSLDVVLNAEQTMAKEMAFAGKSFALTGAAGTGKTTAQREIAKELVRQNKLGIHEFRIQGSGERVTAPSIAFVAYTRIASGNLRKAIHKDPNLEALLQHNITTIHNLLEYSPEFYWSVEQDKECFRFVPRRTKHNKLDITHLIIEESSMLGIDPLGKQLMEALRPGVQIIYIGDINQLQPVFGPSALNFALVQLPVVNLEQVYRQAGDSSILINAHKILAGDTEIIEDASFRIIRGTSKDGKDIQYTQEKLAHAIMYQIPKWIEIGEYDPEQDMFLSPFNKYDLGTDNINKMIAQYVGKGREAVVHEIIAGMTRLYLAEGDRVLFNKQVGTITRIRKNALYYGRAPKQSSVNLTRFGTYTATIEDDDSDDGFSLEGYESLDLDKLMETEVDGKKREASSIVEIEMETGITEVLNAVGDFAPSIFSLGYALTVHKAQGCEWRKVFLIMHKDHSILCHRELFYTAVTRAREQIVIMAKDFMIAKAIKTQRVKGNTIAEKIAYFNSGIMDGIEFDCLPTLY